MMRKSFDNYGKNLKRISRDNQYLPLTMEKRFDTLDLYSYNANQERDGIPSSRRKGTDSLMNSDPYAYFQNKRKGLISISVSNQNKKDTALQQPHLPEVQDDVPTLQFLSPKQEEVVEPLPHFSDQLKSPRHKFMWVPIVKETVNNKYDQKRNSELHNDAIITNKEKLSDSSNAEHGKIIDMDEELDDEESDIINLASLSDVKSDQFRQRFGKSANSIISPIY